MFVIQLDLTHLPQDVFYLLGLLLVLAGFLCFTVYSLIYELLRHRREMQVLKNEGIYLLLQSGEKNASSSSRLFAGKDDALQEPEQTDLMWPDHPVIEP